MKDFWGQRSRKRVTQQTKKKGEGGRNLLLRSLLLGFKSRIIIIKGSLIQMKNVARFHNKTARAIHAHPHLRTHLYCAHKYVKITHRITNTRTQIKARFNAWDEDKTGALGIEEIKHAMAEMGDQPTPEAFARFMKVGVVHLSLHTSTLTGRKTGWHCHGGCEIVCSQICKTAK